MTIRPIGTYYPVPYWYRGINRNGRLQSFRAPEFKYQTERVTREELQLIKSLRNGKSIDSVTKRKKIKPIDKGEWINQLFDVKALYGQTIVDIKSAGFTHVEAKDFVDESIHQSERATDWAINNEHYGNIAAKSALAATFFGVANIVLSNLNNNGLVDSPGLSQICGTLESSSLALRGYVQYKKIYGGRMDDDRARNHYEAEVYGNKISSLFGDLAYLFETKINPVALVASSFTGEKTQHVLKPLLTLFNPLWWKIRMLAEIDQQFGTDLFTFLINSPQALLGIQSAINKVKEIKASGGLNYSYVSERLIELSGLDPKKNKLIDVFPELGRLLQGLFNNGTEHRIESSEKLSRFLAPVLGLFGFAAYGIGVPVKAILGLLNIESKWINLIAKSGSASQQILYLFRMVLPEQFQNKIKRYDQNEKEGLELQKERNNLFHTGVAVCSLNILSTILQLVESDNAVMNTSKEIVDELAERGINCYFSRRRELKGREFRLNNDELYNLDGTAKIISDKVKIEDEKELAESAVSSLK